MTLNKITNILLLLFLIARFSYADTGVQKKQDFYIYQNIALSINQGQDRISQSLLMELISTYPESSLIKPAILLLIEEYTTSNNYKIAMFYIDKLKERFLNSSNIDYFAYLKASLKYKQIQSDKKNQLTIIKTISLLEEFLELYPESRYKYNIATMHTHLHLTNIINNEYIASTYKDIGKDESSKFYTDKNEDIDTKYIQKPKYNIIERIFK